MIHATHDATTSSTTAITVPTWRRPSRNQPSETPWGNMLMPDLPSARRRQPLFCWLNSFCRSGGSWKSFIAACMPASSAGISKADADAAC